MGAFQKLVLSRTNCFLLKAADGYLLIDCGSAGDEQAFLVQLGRLGLTPQSIRYLLLTHHHSDHCGLLGFLLSANPRLKIILSETCAGYLAAGSHFHPTAERYATKALGFAMRLYGWVSGRLTDAFPPYLGRGGDVLWPDRAGALPGFMGISGRLLPTPGHTRDSLSLVVGEDAFVGDAARNLLNFLGAAHEPLLYYDRQVCHESWAKLLTLGVQNIHPAHGPSFPARYLKGRADCHITRSGDSQGRSNAVC